MRTLIAARSGSRRLFSKIRTLTATVQETDLSVMREFFGLTDQATDTRAPFAVVGTIAASAKFNFSGDAIAPNRALAAARRPIGLPQV